MVPPRLVECTCKTCHGAKVPPSTRNSHAARDLKSGSSSTSQAPRPKLLRRVAGSAPSNSHRVKQPIPKRSSLIPEDDIRADRETIFLPVDQDGKQMTSPLHSFIHPALASINLEDLSTGINNPSSDQPAASPPMPARLRRLSVAARSSVIASMQAAEERGQTVIDEALSAIFNDITLADQITGDAWDEDESEPEEDNSGLNPAPNREESPAQEELSATHALANNTPAGGHPTQPHLDCDENNPDPFYSPSVDCPTRQIRTSNDAHRHPAIRLLYVLVAWLHTHFHLPFAACQAVLIVVVHILSLATTPLDTGETYRTLPSVLNHLGVDPEFVVLPVCPGCLEVYPASAPVSEPCARCQSPIFKCTTTSSGHERFRPILQFPTKSIQQQLEDILTVDGAEDVLEQWRSLSRHPGEYIDNFDGEICKTLEGPDQRPFFQNPLPPESKDELRIGLTLGVNWYIFSL